MTSADRVINVNGGDMPIGYYNLLLTIRDLGLYKVGLKPNRHWKITDVKKYFGIKGSAESMLEELNTIKDFLKAK